MRNGMLSLLMLALVGSGGAMAQPLPYGNYPSSYPGAYGTYPHGYPVPATRAWSAPQPSGQYPGYGPAAPGDQPASAPPAPLVITDLSPGAGMWYEDGPAAAPSAPPTKSRGPGIFARWVRGSKAPAPADNPPPRPPAEVAAATSLPQAEDPPSVAAAPPGGPAPDSHDEIPDRVPSGGRMYGSADAMLWWIRRGGTPVLATTGTEANPLAGPLVKDNNFDNQEHLGARATVGFWLNHAQTFGFEAGGLYLCQRDPSVTLRSNGDAPLARPFIDLGTGATGAAILAASGTQSGAIAVRDLTRLWSAEANFRKELLRGCYYHFDVLCGFRYLQFDEGLQIADETTFQAASPFAGTSVVSSDRFGTHNAFYGGQLGAETEIHCRRWDLDLWGKVGLGTNFQVLNINGTTAVLNPDGTTAGVGNGLYAQPPNIGHHTQREFAVLPEFGANLGFQVTPHLRASVGYTFLYLSRVVRPGDQIDQTVTPALGAGAAAAAGATRPALLFHESDFWAQGLNAGLEFRY